MSPQPTLARSIPSPLTTQIPNLSADEIAALPYPPDYYPGARDVKTPYGTMRVYEWGPESGRKVMLVHGDATCAPVWKRVAEGLVGRGCRVCVIDLWGRGYTDTPLVPHTPTLLSLQLLFAASSSPLPWCTETFSIIGFSLGGGITMDFVASFPHLVRSVALLAPAGMIRSLPQVYVDFKEAVSGGKKSEGELNDMLAGVLGVEEEIGGEGEGEFERLVRWQYENHRGHARSFASTLVNGPVVGQGFVWREACGVLKEKVEAREGRERVVVVCGEDDGVVRKEWVREDLDGMLGEGEYVFGTVNGGHGFLIDGEACEKVIDLVAEEWGL